MERIQYLQHKGKRIMKLDFSNCDSQGVIELIEASKPVIASQPPQSLLILDDFTNARYDTKTVEAMKNFTVHNKPYVKGVALIGVTGLQKIIVQSVQTFSKRKLNLFDTQAQAIDWLANQN